MDPMTPSASLRYVTWLPYWAVLQTDIGLTTRSWVYRFWVALSVLAAAGFLLYRYGAYHETGMVQTASRHITELVTWTVAASLSLVVVLAVGSISGERGTLADSVLSRGISRHQYFLAKWHARLFVVLVTYFLVGGLSLIGSYLLLQEDLSFSGCMAALGAMLALLTAVVSLGVAVGALSGNAAGGIAALWALLYGGGFIWTRLPAGIVSPGEMLQRLPSILRGEFNPTVITAFAAASCGVAVVAALAGMVGFSRRDV
jgi:ABC-type transport system involved in multi-copper enzyme maturation permease subunit